MHLGSVILNSILFFAEMWWVPDQVPCDNESEWHQTYYYYQKNV